MASGRPTIICVTPVKNEAWILDAFISRASLWADHIVIADQGSVDGSREIAARHQKVTVVDNPADEYDEEGRQRLLLDAARRIPGPRTIIALDADEGLTGNWPATPEWDRIADARPGTVLRFQWANVLPGFTSAWIPPEHFAFGFVDDGREHTGPAIHSTRVPTDEDAAKIDFQDLKVIHLQHADWSRMKSKQRWYQCWERINNPGKRPVQLYRQYHRMDAIPAEEITSIPAAWHTEYDRAGVTLGFARNDEPLETDRAVLDLLGEHGPQLFRKVDLWHVDWLDLARRLDWDGPRHLLADPRTPADRLVHRWLARTQGRSADALVRWIQRLLILIRW